MKLVCVVFLSILLLGVSPLWAQTAVQVQPAELSVPFGVVSGKMVTVGDFLIFIDDDKPEMSFVVGRNQIQNFSTQNGTLTVQVSQPVRDRSGERTNLSFRLAESTDMSAFTRWFGAPRQSASTSVANGEKLGEMTYQARHKHRFGVGSCQGRLIISDARIAYESINEIDHSRQWELRDIKELKLDNPYEIEIRPFLGGDYKLDLVGKGMDSREYKAVVDRITSARVSR